MPKEALLGSPEVDVKKGFAGVMKTFDNTTSPGRRHGPRGKFRAALQETKRQLEAAGVEIDYDTRRFASPRPRPATSRWKPITRRP